MVDEYKRLKCLAALPVRPMRSVKNGWTGAAVERVDGRAVVGLMVLMVCVRVVCELLLLSLLLSTMGGRDGRIHESGRIRFSRYRRGVGHRDARIDGNSRRRDGWG